jgi:hypothetical protein
MGLGRFVCVLVPFALTLASLIAMLVGGLAGIADKSLYMFEVNTTDLSISPTSVTKLLNLDRREALPEAAPVADVRVPVIAARVPLISSLHNPNLLATTKAQTSTSTSSNLTAADLGLADLYRIGIWNYCYTWQNGTTACSQGQYNWAATALNVTTSQVNSLITSTGLNVTLPSTITDAVNTFSTVTRWTEIVFIIAYICLAVELFFGLFAQCSRIFSCITWLIAAVATVAVCAAATMATVMSVIVVGTLEASAKWYGVTADFNTRFLATVWVGAAFAIAAGFFWSFTICCCAPSHDRSSKRGFNRGVNDEHGEKLIPAGAYAPVGQDQHGHQPYTGGYAQPPQQYGYSSGANGGRYEPYSHAGGHANV